MLRLGLLAVAVSVSIPGHARIIGFPEAVRQALAINPRARVSSAQEAAAYGRVRMTRGYALPTLKLNFSAARSDDPLTVLGYRLAQRHTTFADLGLASYSGAGSLDIAPQALNEPGYANNFDTSVILKVPLFAGGKNLARLRAAKAERAAAVARNAVMRAEITYEVLRAYNGVDAVGQLLEAARSAKRAAMEDLSSATALYRRGIVIRSDVLTARANLEEADAAVQAAAAARADALDEFRNAIGSSTTDELEPGAAVTVPLPAAKLGTLQELAIQSNPSIHVLQEAVAARGAELRAAEAAYWPDVDLIARHDWNAESLAIRAPSNTVMAVLSWNVFTSGVQSGGVDAAAALVAAAKGNLNAAVDALRLKTATRYRAIRITAAQARAANLAATQASEAAHLLSLRYQHGLTPIDALLNAQARRDRERARAVEAGYKAVLARAALLLAINRLDPRQSIVQPLITFTRHQEPAGRS